MPPKNTKEVREFIDIVNYYTNMWDIRSHLLHSLTEITSPKVKCEWTEVEQKEFDDIKRTVAHDTLLAYTDFNKRFYIHLDAIYSQLGSVISQNGKTITFYIIK